MNYRQEVRRISSKCRASLDLSRTGEDLAHLHYPCIPLCIIDAVFSINARAQATANVIERYRRHAGIGSSREHTVQQFIETVDAAGGAERFASEVLHNRQRTSPRGGILKAEVALMYGHVLTEFHVNRRRDIPKIIDSDRFSRRIRLLPGQGVSSDFFLMMLGREDLVKPDRMVARFVSDCLDSKRVAPVMAAHLLAEAARDLQHDHPHMTPRLLDWLVWDYQSDSG